MHKVFEVYKNDIKSKSMVVIGTITPWIEAMSYEYNASQIITLDYTRKKWHDPKLTWYHVNDYLEEAMNKQEIELIDNAATFSSIEHSGLGRFGDPLNPDGDLDVMKQVHCMLKPGGIFIVGALENTPNEKQLNIKDSITKSQLIINNKENKNNKEQKNEPLIFLQIPTDLKIYSFQ